MLHTFDKVRPKLVNMPKFVWIKYYSKLATCVFLLVHNFDLFFKKKKKKLNFDTINPNPI